MLKIFSNSSEAFNTEDTENFKKINQVRLATVLFTLVRRKIK